LDGSQRARKVTGGSEGLPVIFPSLGLPDREDFEQLEAISSVNTTDSKARVYLDRAFIKILKISRLDGLDANKILVARLRYRIKVAHAPAIPS